MHLRSLSLVSSIHLKKKKTKNDKKKKTNEIQYEVRERLHIDKVAKQIVVIAEKKCHFFLLKNQKSVNN